MKAIQKKMITIMIVIITLPVIIFFLIKEKPHQYFDPKNPDNTYTVISDNNYFWIKINDTSVIISSAPTNLDQFLDKKVKLQGKFINTTSDKVLCPIDNCHRSSSRNGLQALEITDISLAE